MIKRKVNKGYTWDDHKYIAKVGTPPNTRYFYKAEDYQAYLKGEHNGDRSSVTSMTSNVSTESKDPKVFIDTNKDKPARLTLNYKKGNFNTVADFISERINEIVDPDTKSELDSGNIDVPKRDNSDEHFNKEYNLIIPPYQKDINDLESLQAKDYECSKDEDMALVNPFYTLESGAQCSEFTQNCSSCSMAYELRQRGYDVEAGAMTGEGPDIEDVISAYNLTMDDVEICLDVTEDNYEPLSNALIEDIIENYGPNTRGQFAVFWKRGGGHSLVWECDGEKVTIRDCQTNTMYSVDEVIKETRAFCYFRTDNAEINLSANEIYIINREK